MSYTAADVRKHNEGVEPTHLMLGFWKHQAELYFELALDYHIAGQTEESNRADQVSTAYWELIQQSGRAQYV